MHSSLLRAMFTSVLGLSFSALGIRALEEFAVCVC